MSINLDSKIQYLKGVGPKMAEKLSRLGIETVEDLIFYYPRDYRDYTNIKSIGNISCHSRFSRESTIVDPRLRGDDNLIDGRDKITICGKILEIHNKKTSRKRFTVTEAVVEDGTGSIKVVWFNQPFLAKYLPAGREVILNGKISFNFFSREVVMESPERAVAPKIEAIYPETSGVTSRYISKLVSSIEYLVHASPTGGSNIEEWMPEELLCHSRFSRESTDSATILDPRVKPEDDKNESENDGLLSIQKALSNIHFPENAEMLEKARRRLAFDELFLIALQANLSKEEIKKEKAPAISINDKKSAYATFLSSLPFKLTDDQRKAAWQILKDMEKDVPMNRLLNGDVGSGKTVVAAIAAFTAVKAGYRVAVMAPTEILAQQHFKTFCGLFDEHGVSIGLFTANCKDFSEPRVKSQGSSKKEFLGSRPSTLDADIVIGTQALIQEDIKLENLGLVIVDEQHRFGVRQRAALQQLAITKTQDTNSKLETDNCELRTAQKMRPHFLSMTATPIPRTLHLALFGDLNISIIKEKPSARKEIKTRLVAPENRLKAYEFVRRQIQSGRQAFVICPLIEEGQGSRAEGQGLFEDERKTVKREYEKLQKIFSEFKIEMLHGRLKAKEKDKVMAEFNSNSLQILVSTSVVEVGIDIPNASTMVIEDAERFGLAQLHQFRGRVGRAEHQSFCFLFSSINSPKVIERLKALETTTDGFKLAEIDLEQRGPGAIFGTEQSGLLDLKMASFSDRELIEEASSAAKSIIKIDPELKSHPLLKNKIADYLLNKHLE
ncbi:MAG: ATP-dependent DNA helicase RecG [bacterium]|nr:ATP-dependent DNA helicase RecG [bacterium]